MPGVGDASWLGRGKLVLGMIHLPPLPGTPYHDGGGVEPIVERAVASALALVEGGADGCLIQTVDRVYAAGRDSDPARIAALSLVTHAVVEAAGPAFRVGAQLMRNAVQASLAVTKVAGGDFTRVGALVGATMTAGGLVQGDPLAVAEYRHKIDAQALKLIVEIESMHFTWFGGGKSVGEVAALARQAGADAVSLCHRDDDVTVGMIAAVRAACPGLPVILAGHTHHGNAARLLGPEEGADGAFVGTCLEADGWGSAIDRHKVAAYVDIVRSAQG
ncbi:BtpA/SgcQ family protein [Herbidospora cretacea]|uniref:BtpA/SgcQ family protein n=1 Tax=Herbidospora cretacea TaxID=28444 RepID=UPI0007C7B4C5|nr:BtpA/SgcQ family protein [Herbidospora cretacea]